MAALLIVGDDRAARRILTDESSSPARPAALRLDALLCRACRHECGLLCDELRSQMTQRRDVIDDPDAAPVCGKNEIVVPRLNRQIPDCDRGDMAPLELCPVRTSIG